MVDCYKSECKPLTDLDENNEFECLMIPTHDYIETLYDKYIDEVIQPLDFE